MTVQTLHLTLPDLLYQQVKQRAGKTNRTVEAEVIAAVEAFVTLDENESGIPQAMAEELAQLSFLEDTHLYQAARQVASTEKNERVQELVLKQHAEGLTEAEAQEAQQLQEYAQRLMLIRAEAVVLLQQRGYDISTLYNSVSPSAANDAQPPLQA